MKNSRQDKKIPRSTSSPNVKKMFEVQISTGGQKKLCLEDFIDLYRNGRSIFVNRTDPRDWFDVIREKLNGDEPCVIYGDQGNGKTTLVLGYIFKQANIYPGGVYWVNLDRLLNIRASEIRRESGMLDGIRSMFSSNGAPRSIEGLVIEERLVSEFNKVFHFNAQNKDELTLCLRDFAKKNEDNPILFFIDNVPDMSLVADFLRALSPHKIIVTARGKKQVKSSLVEMPNCLRPFSREEAKEFLHNQLGVTRTPNTEKYAAEIAGHFDNSPLLLRQFAHYLTIEDIKLESSFSAKRAREISSGDQNKKVSNRKLYNVLHCLMSGMSKEANGEEAMLELCKLSLIDNSNLSKVIIKKYVGVNGFNLLLKYGFIDDYDRHGDNENAKASECLCSMHMGIKRTVVEILFDKHTEFGYSSPKMVYLKVLSDLEQQFRVFYAMPGNEESDFNFNKSKRLSEAHSLDLHSYSFLVLQNRFQFDSQEVSCIFNLTLCAAYLFYRRGDFAHSYFMVKNAISEIEKGPIYSYLLLARLYVVKGKCESRLHSRRNNTMYGDAEMSYKKAIESAEKESTAIGGPWRLVTLDEKKQKNISEIRLIAQSSLAVLRLKRLSGKEADSLSKDTLEKKIALYGNSNHPELGVGYMYRGKTLYSMERYKKIEGVQGVGGYGAEECYREAQKIFEEFYTKKLNYNYTNRPHVNLITLQYYWALFYYKQGYCDKAEEKCLPVYENLSQSFDVVYRKKAFKFRLLMGQIRLKQHKTREAIEIFEAILKDGELHSKSVVEIDAKHYLARAYSRLARFKEATKCFREALELQSILRLPVENIAVDSVTSDFFKTQLAVPTYKRVLHVESASILHYWALSFYKQANYSFACFLYTEALRINFMILNKDSQREFSIENAIKVFKEAKAAKPALTILELANIDYRLGRYGEAITKYESVYEIQKNKFGEAVNEEVKNLLFCWARVCIEVGKIHEAKEHLEKIQISENDPDIDAIIILCVKARYYQQIGAYSEAQKSLAQAEEMRQRFLRDGVITRYHYVSIRLSARLCQFYSDIGYIYSADRIFKEEQQTVRDLSSEQDGQIEHPEAAAMYVAMGNVLLCKDHDEERFASAKSYFEKAGRFLEEIYPNQNHLEKIRVSLYMADLLYQHAKFLYGGYLSGSSVLIVKNKCEECLVLYEQCRNSLEDLSRELKVSDSNLSFPEEVEIQYGLARCKILLSKVGGDKKLLLDARDILEEGQESATQYYSGQIEGKVFNLFLFHYRIDQLECCEEQNEHGLRTMLSKMFFKVQQTKIYPYLVQLLVNYADVSLDRQDYVGALAFYEQAQSVVSRLRINNLAEVEDRIFQDWSSDIKEKKGRAKLGFRESVSSFSRLAEMSIKTTLFEESKRRRLLDNNEGLLALIVEIENNYDDSDSISKIVSSYESLKKDLIKPKKFKVIFLLCCIAIKLEDENKTEQLSKELESMINIPDRALLLNVVQSSACSVFRGERSFDVERFKRASVRTDVFCKLMHAMVLAAIAKIQENKEDFFEALNFYNNAHNIFEELVQQCPEAVTFYVQNILSLLNCHIRNRSFHFVKFSLRQLDDGFLPENPFYKQKLLLIKSRFAYETQCYQDARKFVLEASELAEPRGFFAVDLYKMLGRTHIALGFYKEAAEYYILAEKALAKVSPKCFENEDMFEEYSKIRRRIIGCYFYSCQFNKVIDHCNLILTESGRYKYDNPLSVYAEIYLCLIDPSGGIGRLEQRHDEITRLKDVHVAALYYRALSKHYLALTEFAKALDYGKQSLDVIDFSYVYRMLVYQSILRNDIGLIFKAQGENIQALSWFKGSLERQKKLYFDVGCGLHPEFVKTLFYLVDILFEIDKKRYGKYVLSVAKLIKSGDSVYVYDPAFGERVKVFIDYFSSNAELELLDLEQTINGLLNDIPVSEVSAKEKAADDEAMQEDLNSNGNPRGGVVMFQEKAVVPERPSFHKMLIREVSEASSSEQQIITLDNLVSIANELAVLRLRLVEIVEANLEKSKGDEHEQWRVTQLALEGNANKLKTEFKNKDHLLHAVNICGALGGNTPLMLACLFGWVDVVKYYDSKGQAGTDLRNCLGMTDGHLAVIGGHVQILEILGSNLPNLEMKIRIFNGQVIDCDLLALAVLFGRQDVVEKLLSFPEHQNSLKTARPYGNILHLAVLANRRPLLTWLLQNELVREAKLFNQEGVYENIGGKREKFTPLALAVFLGYLEVMKLILSFPRNIVDINAGSQLMPVNFAVMAFNSSALRVLIKRGADLTKLNANNQAVLTQIDVLKLTDADSAHQGHYVAMRALVTRAQRSDAVKQYCGVQVKPKRIENLIFRGGGIKGVAYAGALLALAEQLKDSNYPEYSFPNVLRVGGTSAGALTAFLIGMGKSASDIGEALRKFPFKEILETVSGRATQGISPGKPAKKDISKIGSALEFALAAFETAVRQGHMLELVMPLLDFEGLSTGETLRAELTKILLEQGLGEEGKLFTFGQWRELVKSDEKKYKHIHIVTSCIKGPNPGCHVFHSEKPEQADRGVYDDVVIVDAVAASMAFPGAFMPQKIRCVASDGTPYDFNQGAEYLDGGILMNYPVGIFDQRGFTDPFNIYADKKYPDVNKSTLGFTLVDPSDAEQGTSLLSKIAKVVRGHSNLVDRLSAVVSFYMHAEAYFAKIRMPDDFRTVVISNLGYKTSDVVIDDAQKDDLTDSGRKAVKDFFAGVRQSDAPKVAEEAKSHRERSKWDGVASASASVSPAPALPVVEAEESDGSKNKKKKKKKSVKKEGKAPRPK